MNKFEELEKRCESFDWTYPFSDDHRSWVAGENAKYALGQLIRECEAINKKRTREIVLKHQPEYGVCFYTQKQKRRNR